MAFQDRELVLSFGQSNNETRKLARHFDLAGKPRIGLCGIGKTQHAGFGVADGIKLVEPRVVDVDMAGAASALAPAVAIDTGDTIVQRPLHQRNAVRQFDFMPFPVLLNIDDFRHTQSFVLMF
ncbi:hypothetical protein [Bradyrhizobium sp.]|uniref:hypothetical protein n=1 Tax=Bradyrhizobium sp. TaxID=376 RepID=UPI003C7B7A49